jgi:hypothetical protein
MKKLLGFLFCLGFLLFASPVQSQQATVSSDQLSVSSEQLSVNIDIGWDFSINRFAAAFVKAGYSFDRQMQAQNKFIDLQALRAASAQAVYKANLLMYVKYRYSRTMSLLYDHPYYRGKMWLYMYKYKYLL